MIESLSGYAGYRAHRYQTLTPLASQCFRPGGWKLTHFNNISTVNSLDGVIDGRRFWTTESKNAEVHRNSYCGRHDGPKHHGWGFTWHDGSRRFYNDEPHTYSLSSSWQRERRASRNRSCKAVYANSRIRTYSRCVYGTPRPANKRWKAGGQRQRELARCLKLTRDQQAHQTSFIWIQLRHPQRLRHILGVAVEDRLWTQKHKDMLIRKVVL